MSELRCGVTSVSPRILVEPFSQNKGRVRDRRYELRLGFYTSHGLG